MKVVFSITTILTFFYAFVKLFTLYAFCIYLSVIQFYIQNTYINIDISFYYIFIYNIQMEVKKCLL